MTRFLNNCTLQGNTLWYTYVFTSTYLWVMTSFPPLSLRKYFMKERSRIQSLWNKLSLTGVISVSSIYVRLKWYLVEFLEYITWWYLPAPQTSYPSNNPSPVMEHYWYARAKWGWVCLSYSKLMSVLQMYSFI